jgi:protein involved in polysaccharide export with SLBB domain
MSQFKFALGASAALVTFLSLFAASSSAQNIQIPGVQAGGLSQGAALGGGAAGLGAMSAGGVPSIRSADPAAAQANFNTSNAANAALLMQPEPLKPNDFQKFVLETAGYKLPLYGQSFFENVQANQRALQLQQSNMQSIQNNTQPGAAPVLPVVSGGFAPIDNAPVSGDYLLGPGDQVVIRGWGSLDIDVRTQIDRNGAINLPRVGAVNLAGVKAAQAEGVLRNAVGKYFKDFQLSVTLGQLRTVTVYVVGQARRPGSYALSGVSTLSSGLLATGGPSASGSMRRVQLKRAGKVVAEFDLYAFLSQGDSTGDIKLTDGDVIVIPPAVGHIALVGKVNNPAVYELKNQTETLEQLLSVAGGMPVNADPRRVSLERLSPDQAQPRSVEDFALDAKGLQTALRNGDLLTVSAILPELSNAVTLRGNVTQPIRLAWKQGMRVRDLIPNKEALISRDSIRRQNETLFDATQRERTQREREMIAEDLLEDKDVARNVQRQAAAQGRNQRQSAGQPSQSNQAAQNNMRPDLYDIESFREQRELRLFSQQAPIEARYKNEVPSVADTVGNLFDEVNWDYAVIERINRKDQSVSVIPFNLLRVLADAKDPDNQVLESGDVVTVFSVNDMRVPISKRRVMVRIEGEVMQPGIYQVKPGETLNSVLQKAGGLSHDAYLFGSALYREEVRKSQVENLQKLVRRLESESGAQLAQLSQSMGASSDANLAQARIAAAQQAQKQSLERVKSLRPEGRVALGLEPVLYNHIKTLPEIRLQNGDKFIVPPRPDFVYVYGAVNTESALIYKTGQSVRDYLKLSGMSSAADKNGVILVRADGSAQTNDGSWFSSSMLSADVMPGDSIVVPDKVDMEATWSTVVRNTKDITQIFYQLGLGAAALKTLR